MNLKELEDFRLVNAVQFHDVLNPVLFRDEHMIPAVRNRLLEIADDFMEHLGVSNIDVKDITLSGSNASYTYTPHSDIDLHILVDIKKLDHDEIYAELFHVKKIIWNLQHDITIGGYEVELYVQDSAQPVISRGEYSVLNDRWIKFPTKRSADVNEPASKLKFEKLVQVAELALKARDMNKIEAVLDIIRKYRKAGLEAQGEFSPENIAFKAFRTSGLLHRLRDVYNEIHSEKMSMEQKVGAKVEQPVYTISELAKMHGCSRNDIISELKRGIKFEMANTSVRSLATEMAYKNLANNAKHYSQLRDDYDPNGKPPGPEFKPTMPKGTVRVDVSDVYDWYKLGQHISNMKGLGHHDFGKGPPSTILSFGDEDTEHKYIDDLEKTGLTTTDIDPIDPNQPKGMKRQKVDPTFNVGVAEGSSEKVNVQAHRNGDTVWIDYFEVTPKKQGYGTKIYQEWENSLPADVKVIKLIASDAGDGPSDKFWDQMGFDYVYDDDDGPIEMIKYLHQAKQRVAEGLGTSIKESSGYIPSEAEKDDPRFKTAVLKQR